MSIYSRLYRARVAPASEDWRSAIYNGVDVVDAGDLWTESFASDAFIAAEEPIPVWLSHEDKPVGQVVARAVHAGWHTCDFTLDHSRPLSAVALDVLRVGAPVSLGARSLRHDKLLARDGVMRHTIARNETPAYRGAQITGIYEMPPARRSKTASVSPELQPGDEVFYGSGPYGGGGLIRRPAIGQVLGVS